MRKDLIESNPILKLSFDFALMIINYIESLESKRKYVISNQLLKSGTSIGANAMEAQNSESKADFIHKIKIAAKEAEESQYWLTLCDYAPQFPDCKSLLSKLVEIKKILAAIISSSKRKNPIIFLLSFLIF